MIKISEEVQKIINELSDDTKASYLAKRQAQFDKAQKALNKAKTSIKKSDDRQISTMPEETDKETATKILKNLKYEMQKISNGSDWRFEDEDDYMSLEVRYWGDWEGDDGSGDYDWQELTSEYREKLDSILSKIQKKYGVQIYEPGAEKNWLVFEIKLAKNQRDIMWNLINTYLSKISSIFEKAGWHKDESDPLLNFYYHKYYTVPVGGEVYFGVDTDAFNDEAAFGFTIDSLPTDDDFLMLGKYLPSIKKDYILIDLSDTAKLESNLKAVISFVKDVLEELDVNLVNQKLRDFDGLKGEYVDKLTHMLEADGWNLVESENVYGFDTEYTYEKYIEPLEENVYCVFAEDDFYHIGFSVGSPKNEDWDEAQLSNFIELPSHPIYPEKMDHFSLDPRYDGSTAKDEWNQYVKFLKNTLATLKNPKLLK